jgi:ACS family phthalate transporter-like MFS transporter
MTETNDDGRATYRRIYLRLIPFLMLLYLICYVDRVNIGFAKLQFLPQLGLNDAQFGLATGLFFITYSLFDIPSNLMLSRIGVRKTLLRIMLLWGALTASQMFINGATSLYVLRVLFGAAEAGFIPGIMLYLTFWFPNRHKAQVVSLFLMGVPLSGIIGGPISGGIMAGFDGASGLRGWQWLFLLEGLPAIILGGVAYFYLQDGPDEAKWLSATDRQRLAADMAADKAAAMGSKGTHDFRGVLRDPMIYVFALMNFAVNCGVNAISFWTPSLLREAGLANVSTIGWVTGLISLISAGAMVLVGRSSDRHMERRWHFIACGVLAAGGLLALPFGHDNVVLTTLILIVAGVGNLCIFSLYWALPTAYLQGRGAAGGIALASMVGAMGSGVSPTIIGFMRVETGSLYGGLAAVAGIVVFGMGLALMFLRPIGEPLRPSQMKGSHTA